MDDFPSNSRRPANPPVEQKKVEPVAVGSVIHRKKSLGRRLRETFFRGEGGVLTYLVLEVVVPALQDLVIQSVTQGVERAVGRPIRTGNPPYRSIPQRPHVNYSTPSIVRSPAVSAPQYRVNPTPPPSSVEIGEIIVDTQITAEIVLEKLKDIVEQYQVASVADLKGIIGESPSTTDHKWGWNEDTANFGIRRVRAGWLLVIPDPIDLR